jgi:succinate dehydrogenase/fumarate reductase flavoprotein subunit
MYAREKPNKQISESRISQDEAHLSEIMARADNGDSPAKIRSEMGVTMNDYAAVFRTTDGMKIAREKLVTLK